MQYIEVNYKGNSNWSFLLASPFPAPHCENKGNYLCMEGASLTLENSYDPFIEFDILSLTNILMCKECYPGIGVN